MRPAWISACMFILSAGMLCGQTRDDDDVVARGDTAFFRMDYAGAEQIYERGLRADSLNTDLLWRQARVLVCDGEVEQEAARAMECFRSAELMARQCAALDSTRPEGHTWRAAALGYLALDTALAVQVKLTQELKRETDMAIALDSTDDAAYSIRGSMYRALGNVSWFQRQLAAIFLGRIPAGGREEAEADLRKAMRLAPRVMRHPYELGMLYRDWGRMEEAASMLRIAMSLPVQVAIDIPRLKKIRELLSTGTD